MTNKFKMGLVWHNCNTYPPEEEYNECLLVTDGDFVAIALYDSGKWYDMDDNNLAMLYDLNKLWWADIEQTVHGTKFN